MRCALAWRRPYATRILLHPGKALELNAATRELRDRRIDVADRPAKNGEGCRLEVLHRRNIGDPHRRPMGVEDQREEILTHQAEVQRGLEECPRAGRVRGGHERNDVHATKAGRATGARLGFGHAISCVYAPETSRIACCPSAMMTEGT
jgi:hypothetical protein